MASAYLTIWTELSNYEDLFNEHLKIVNYIQEWLYDESLAISNAIYYGNVYDKVIGITFFYDEVGEDADVYNKIKGHLTFEILAKLPSCYHVELIPQAKGDYKKWFSGNDILKEEYKANHNPNSEPSRFVSGSIGIQLTDLKSKISVLCNYERSRFANLENAEPFLYSKVQYYQNT